MAENDASRQCVFAAAPYANSMPLAACLEQVSSRARLLWEVPAHLAGWVLQGRADAGLMPVLSLLAHDELTMIDGLGVCARRKVMSVLLKCRVGLEQVRTVALDPASRTSNALAQLILRRHWRRRVAVLPAGSGPADAAVVIGDRALQGEPAPGGDYDLAEQWHAMTGLPFVFAVWGHRADNPRAGELAEIARAARRAGLAAIEPIARGQAEKLGLGLSLCRRYFAEAVYYTVGPRERQAIELFGRLAAEEGLLAAPACAGREAAP